MGTIGKNISKFWYYLSRDLLEYIRYKTAIVSSLLLSVVMVFSFGGMSESGSYFPYVLPGILAIGIMNSCVFSASYNMAMDREKHLTDDIVLSFGTYILYLASKYTSNIIKSAVSFFAVILLSCTLFDIEVHDWMVLAGCFFAASVMFVSIGMLFATMTDILSLGGLANLVIVPFTYFSGVFFPVTSLEGVLRTIAEKLPITSVIELFRYGLEGVVVFGRLSVHAAYVASVTTLLVVVTVITYNVKLKRGY